MLKDSHSSTDDHELFMRLFLEHEPQILRAIMVLVPQRSDARDILQDTAVVLWQKFSDYDRNRPFTNWALGFARMHIRRFFRTLQRRNQLSEKAMEALLNEETEDQATFEKRHLALRSCLEELPTLPREMIEGYYLQEKDVSELATRHNKSVEAVYKSLQRLRRSLLECMNRKLAET
jgi:RNA polymerase sigma-70 factor, ECF subfamily